MNDDSKQPALNKKSDRKRAPKQKKEGGLVFPSPVLGIVEGTPSRVIEATFDAHNAEIRETAAKDTRQANYDAAAKVSPLSASDSKKRQEIKAEYNAAERAARAGYDADMRAAQSRRDAALSAAGKVRDEQILQAGKDFNALTQPIEQGLKQAIFTINETKSTGLAAASAEFRSYMEAAIAAEKARAEKQEAERKAKLEAEDAVKKAAIEQKAAAVAEAAEKIGASVIRIDAETARALGAV